MNRSFRDKDSWPTRRIRMDVAIPATPQGWLLLAVVAAALCASVLLTHRALPALVLFAAFEAWRSARS